MRKDAHTSTQSTRGDCVGQQRARRVRGPSSTASASAPPGCLRLSPMAAARGAAARIDGHERARAAAAAAAHVVVVVLAVEVGGVKAHAHRLGRARVDEAARHSRTRAFTIEAWSLRHAAETLRANASLSVLAGELGHSFHNVGGAVL